MAQVVCVAPCAIVDYPCQVSSAQLKALLGPEEAVGGSARATLEYIQALQSRLPSVAVLTLSGGSASNVARTLAGLGLTVQLLTSCGSDPCGSAFLDRLQQAGVDTLHTQRYRGPTGQCVVLCAEGQRTMRTFLHPGGVLRAADVEERAFSAAGSGVGCGVSWVFLSAYLAYSPGLMQRCVHLAHRCGRRVALDLASFEVVRTFWPDLLALLAAGAVDVCVCNEDEAAAVAACLGAGLPARCLDTAGTEQATSAPDQAQGWLSKEWGLDSGLERRPPWCNDLRPTTKATTILQPSPAGTDLSKTPLQPGSACAGTAAHLATRWPAQCSALDFLARHCKRGAVVTLGAQGCLAAGAVSAAPDTGSTQVPSGAVAQVPPQDREVDHLAATARCSADAVAVDECRPTEQHAKPECLHAGPPAQLPLLSWGHQPAIAGVVVVDSTGAGDAFTSGLLYGLTQGHALTSPQCLRMGCVAGAAAVLGLGAELTPAGWAFCTAHMASSLSN